MGRNQALRTFSINHRKSKISGSRPGLSRSFLQDLGWDLSQAHAKFEHGRFRTASPARDLPMRAHELHIRLPRKVDEHRILARIELLRKGGDRFRLPRRAVGRTEDAQVERLLLD